MRWIRPALIACLLILAVPVGSVAFSLKDEVTVIDPNLVAETVWEMTDTKTYCQSSPPNLDRLICRENVPDEFTIGVDALGNRYGVIVTIEPLGTFFDIYRRPVGTSFNNHIIRITKRVEVVVGKPIKMFAVGNWEIDVTSRQKETVFALQIIRTNSCFTVIVIRRRFSGRETPSNFCRQFPIRL